MKAPPTSVLMATATTNAVGLRETVIYEWRGKSPYLKMTSRGMDELVKIDDRHYRVGPYSLLFLEHRPWEDAVLFVRDDQFGAVRVALYKATRGADLVYRRMIITLAVWGLADYHAAQVPTWRDIRFLKWMHKR